MTRAASHNSLVSNRAGTRAQTPLLRGESGAADCVVPPLIRQRRRRATGASPRRHTRSPAQPARPRPFRSPPASRRWRGGQGRAGHLRCPPTGLLPCLRWRYLLTAVHLNGQVDAPPATPDEPPRPFPEPRCPGEPGQEGRLDGPVESLACRQPLDPCKILRAVPPFACRSASQLTSAQAMAA
jgi:hypothetical protein